MKKFAIAAIAVLFSITAANAQAPAPTPTPPPAKEMKAKPKKVEKPRSAESLECSKQADTKNLHGKERKTFRAKCMKDLKKKAA